MLYFVETFLTTLRKSFRKITMLNAATLAKTFLAAPFREFQLNVSLYNRGFKMYVLAEVREVIVFIFGFFGL